MQRDLFDSISPLDHRYYASSPELFERLASYLSESATIRYQARVEAALVRGLSRMGICPPRIAEEVERACAAVLPDEVYAEEQKTRHNIRALVNVIRSEVSDEAKPFVHFTATSVDIIDTARALQLKDVALDVVIPLLKDLVRVLIEIARAGSRHGAGRAHARAARGAHHLRLCFGRVRKPAGQPDRSFGASRPKPQGQDGRGGRRLQRLPPVFRRPAGF